jgi:type I restriction enzyme, S subunit
VSFSRYPRYKASGLQWLREVPEHWAVKRLRFLAQVNPSKSEVASLNRETVVSFLPMDAVGDDGTLCLDFEKPISEVENGFTYFRNGDVTVAKITPCFENGKGALMRGLANGIGFGTTELIVVRPNPRKIIGTYLHYLFTSRDFRSHGESHMYGAGGQKRVPEAFVRNFAAAFPPLTEQARITAFLDRETAKIDELVGEQRRLMGLLREKRQAVMSHAVTKGLNPNARMKPSGVEWLGDLPEHWDTRTIAKASTKITNGYVGPTRDILVATGTPYIQATHIKGGRINFDDGYFVTTEWSNAHAKSILFEDDVLIVQTGAGTGDVALVSKNEVGFNCHALIIVSPDESLIRGTFLSAVLQSTYGQEKLASIQTGAMHPHLNCGEVKFVEVPLPPRAEQTEIVQHIRDAADRFDTLTGEAQRAIDVLQERRTALISAAVTGQIDVRAFTEREALVAA